MNVFLIRCFFCILETLTKMIEGNTTVINRTNIQYGKDYFTSINAVISGLIYVVNSSIIYLFYVKRRRLLASPSNRLLFSLFIVDFLNGISINFQLIPQLFPSLLGHVGIMYRISVDIYTTFLVESVVMHLCGITLDRYVSLFYALHYRRLVTARSTRRYLAFAWSLPLFASSIQFSWLYRVIVKSNDQDNIADIDTKYSLCSFIIFLAIPMWLLGVAFIAMFLEIRRLLQTTPNQAMNTMSRISAKQRRVLYLFSLMYLCFLTLAMPYFTFRFYCDMKQMWDKPEEMNKFMFTFNLIYTLKNLTSLINPLLYTGINRDTRLFIGKVYAEGVKNLRYRFSKLCIPRRGVRLSIRRASVGEGSIRNESTYKINIAEECTDDYHQRCCIELIQK